jgi:hypothetical protein
MADLRSAPPKQTLTVDDFAIPCDAGTSEQIFLDAMQTVALKFEELGRRREKGLANIKRVRNNEAGSSLKEKDIAAISSQTQVLVDECLNTLLRTGDEGVVLEAELVALEEQDRELSKEVVSRDPDDDRLTFLRARRPLDPKTRKLEVRLRSRVELLTKHYQDRQWTLDQEWKQRHGARPTPKNEMREVLNAVTKNANVIADQHGHASQLSRTFQRLTVRGKDSDRDQEADLGGRVGKGSGKGAGVHFKEGEEEEVEEEEKYSNKPRYGTSAHRRAPTSGRRDHLTPAPFTPGAVPSTRRKDMAALTQLLATKLKPHSEGLKHFTSPPPARLQASFISPADSTRGGLFPNKKLEGLFQDLDSSSRSILVSPAYKPTKPP